MVLALFYVSLIVACGTIVIVAVKGFMELIAPIRAAKKKEAEERAGNGS